MKSNKEEIAKLEDKFDVENNDIVVKYNDVLQVVDDIILKRYIADLSNMEVTPLDKDILRNNIKDNVLFFKVNEMVYEKDEFASHKFSSVFNTLSEIKTSIFVIIDSDGLKTDFYMGIRSMEEDKTTSSLKNTLKNAMFGQFPGVKTTDYTIDEIENIVSGIKCESISAVSCVGNNRKDSAKNNAEFIQGLEKLVLSMNGEKYTGIILANTMDQIQLNALRKSYETAYTQLSTLATIQYNYAQNSSKARNESNSEGTNNSKTITNSKSYTEGSGSTSTTSTSHSESRANTASKIVKSVGSTVASMGTMFAPFTAAQSLLVGGVISAGIALAGDVLEGTNSDSVSKSDAQTTNKSYSDGESIGDTVGTSTNYTYGTSSTEGLSNAITLTKHDKSIENILIRIDKQLERMNEFESLGMYECAAYFLSDDQCTAEIAASTYKAIVAGENTGVEVSGISSWGFKNSGQKILIEQYVKNFMHPVFKYNGAFGEIEVTPGAMISGEELSIHMGLPRKSVCGLPVIEHSNFAKEVVTHNDELNYNGVNLGKVFNMGSVCKNNVILDKSSLTMHTFVTGSTGSGKSNTIYEIIRQCNSMGAAFMIIEPAKGEYKHVFGNQKNVSVFGSNPNYSELLRINPFKFSTGIHVLEHVDRLVEIFNVCWPMYAAMPAVLKDAILSAYENCGWDLSMSQNKYRDEVYPTFIDLQDELVNVINSSAYSQEMKSNYMGALVTRVKSLTNGLNGQIFVENEIDNIILFDKNVIIDLSRIGSAETKSLIMGILIMRLSEYRMSTSAGMNIPFKHMTILEEAHNILRSSSSEQSSENAGMASKSVEMISNAIAEMRTYGEGFVIVDQSPTSVDISAIKNTNTKIIMRLPDESDRRLAGKSAGLKEEQLDEISKLAKGVAVVYQNDWVEPVLCKINKYKGEESAYIYNSKVYVDESTQRLKKNLLELVLSRRVNRSADINVNNIELDINKASIAQKNKIKARNIVKEYKLTSKLTLWDDKNFHLLADMVSDILNLNENVKRTIMCTSEFEELTDNLMSLVDSQIHGISREYNLSIVQCLMRSQISGSEEFKQIYSAWITDLRNKQGALHEYGF